MDFLLKDKTAKIIAIITLVLVFLIAIILMFTRQRITQAGNVKREFGMAFQFKKTDVAALRKAAEDAQKASEAKPEDANLKAAAQKALDAYKDA